jgi:hypothetical protein
MYNTRAFIVKCYGKPTKRLHQMTTARSSAENSSTNANGKVGADERMSISNTGKQYK